MKIQAIERSFMQLKEVEKNLGWPHFILGCRPSKKIINMGQGEEIDKKRIKAADLHIKVAGLHFVAISKQKSLQGLIFNANLILSWIAKR